jgi:hypothetical protein
MTLNVKLGDSNNNSYVSLSQAEDYFDTRSETTNWDNLATTAKESALIQAARDLQRFNFIEEPYYDSQNLIFPLESHEVVTGKCATPITNTSFRNSNLYSSTYNEMPEDYWKYGTVHITSGTPLRDTRAISNSNVVNGSITIASAFSATPTTNTSFLIFAPLDPLIYDAQCEQALYLLDNVGISSYTVYTNLGAESVSIGDVSVTFGDGSSSYKIPFSPGAKKLLSRWIKRSLKVGRS